MFYLCFHHTTDWSESQHATQNLMINPVMRHDLQFFHHLEMQRSQGLHLWQLLSPPGSTETLCSLAEICQRCRQYY